MGSILMNKNIKKYILLGIIFGGILIFSYGCTSNKQNKQFANIEKGPSLNSCKHIKGMLELSNKNTFIICEGKNSLRVAELYNPKINEFILLPEPNFPHKNQVFLFEKNNKIYILDDNPLEIFDIDNNKFIKTDLCVSEKDCQSPKRYALTSFLAYNYDDKNFLIYAPYSSIKLYLWNYTTGEKKPLPEMNIPRIGYRILFSKNNEILIVGGYKLNSKDTKEIINNAELYNKGKNKFDLLSDFNIDGNIIISTKPYDAQFETEKFVYIYDNYKKHFIKNQKLNLDREYQQLQINNNVLFLTYTDCNLLYCTEKTKFYLINSNTYIKGPELLYNTYLNRYIKINEDKFLLINNYKEQEWSSAIPTRETQILNVTNKENIAR